MVKKEKDLKVKSIRSDRGEHDHYGDIPILPPASLPDPPASPVITPSTSHPVPPIQPPDVSPDHALSDFDFDLDVADATPEVDLAPPRREKRISGWLYSTGLHCACPVHKICNYTVGLARSAVSKLIGSALPCFRTMISISEHQPTMILVNISSRDMVAPATPTQRHNLFLSCFDFFWTPSHYNQRLLFYENVLSSPQDHIMEKLKSSLALCLVHYYPWCGRLVQGGKTADGRPTIDCNDAGVEFVEASVDVPMSQLSSRGFQIQPFFEKLCQHVDQTAENSPLLSIQATLFSDGGLSLGISQSHVVADGQALWDFMNPWSECSRGLALSVPPLLDRTILAVPNPSPEKASTRKFNATKKVEDTEDPPLVDNPPSVGTDSSLGDPPNPSLTQCLFIIPSSAIKQLKGKDGGVHTSYEVMCAHIWKRVSVARQRPPYEPTIFFVLANCRSRLKPPLPSTYFGNAIGFNICESTSEKVCSETLHATACRIHETVVVVIDSLEGFINWVEIPGNDLYKVLIPNMPKGKSLNVASSPRFPVYEVDFGWGKPSAVRSPKVPGDGEIVLFGGNPKLNVGDVDFCIGLPSDALTRLIEDSAFLAKVPYSPFM
ncbi:hypothetical protein L7F22_015409 [Adiantum nelumboides]|nr:hypothetical protein [Adiantum nelumboides]